MKKFAFLGILAFGLILTSCKEDCYECTISLAGANNMSICEGKACNGTSCTDLPKGTSNKEQADYYTALGYTCTKK